jgi:hypothetical protein
MMKCIFHLQQFVTLFSFTSHVYINVIKWQQTRTCRNGPSSHNTERYSHFSCSCIICTKVAHSHSCFYVSSGKRGKVKIFRINFYQVAANERSLPPARGDGGEAHAGPQEEDDILCHVVVLGPGKALGELGLPLCVPKRLICRTEDLIILNCQIMVRFGVVSTKSYTNSLSKK